MHLAMHPTRDCQGNIYLQYIMFTIKTVTPCGVWFGPGGRPPALKEVMGSGGHFPEVDAPEVGARLCMQLHLHDASIFLVFHGAALGVVGEVSPIGIGTERRGYASIEELPARPHT